MKNAVKKTITNLIIVLGLIALTFWFLFKDQDVGEILRVAKEANTGFIALGLFIMLLYFFMESLNIKCILKSFDNKISIFKALKFTLIGFFFSGITPAASGGQPMEIYYMSKENISGAHATMTLLLQLCGFQISTLSLGIICAIINPGIFVGNAILPLFIVGVIINGFALALMLMCIFSKKMTKKIIKTGIKLVNFFRFKKKDDKIDGLLEGMVKYTESSKYIKEHKKEFVMSILRVFIQIILYYLIPFCVYKAFGLNDYNIFQLFTMQAVLYTTTSGLPLPGAIGVSETAFLTIFGGAFGTALLSSAMLLNRGISFYIFMIVGIIVVLINAIRKKNVVGEIDKKLEQ